MNAGWVVAGHLLLAPLLALSQPPWSGMVMMLVRSGMTLLFLLVLWVLLMLWWRRRGSVDHLFQRVDNMLMNGWLPESHPDVTPENWYDVLGIPAEDEDVEGTDPGVPFLPDRAELVTGETE